MQIKKETKTACKSGFSIWRRPGATKAVEWPGRLRAAYPRRRAVGFSGKTNSTGSILSCIGKKGRARGGGRILGPSPFDRETRSPPSPSPRACLYRSLSLLGSEFAALAAFVEKSVPLYPGSSSFVFAPRGTFPAGLLSPMALALGERVEGWGGGWSCSRSFLSRRRRGVESYGTRDVHLAFGRFLLRSLISFGGLRDGVFWRQSPADTSMDNCGRFPDCSRERMFRRGPAVTQLPLPFVCSEKGARTAVFDRRLRLCKSPIVFCL